MVRLDDHHCPGFSPITYITRQPPLLPLLHFWCSYLGDLCLSPSVSYCQCCAHSFSKSRVSETLHTEDPTWDSGQLSFWEASSHDCSHLATSWNSQLLRLHLCAMHDCFILKSFDYILVVTTTSSTTRRPERLLHPQATTTSWWMQLCSPSEHQDRLDYFPMAICTTSTKFDNIKQP